jgi:hypothetical protein
MPMKVEEGKVDFGINLVKAIEKAF